MATEPTQTATVTATDSDALLESLRPTPAIGSQEIVALGEPKGRVSKVPIARAKELASKINLKDSQSVLTFGVEAQKATTVIADQMLQGVRTKDTGNVGQAMNSMVRDMKGLDFGKLATGQKPGFFQKLLGKASVLQNFLDQYKTVEGQIQATYNVLEGHRVQMLKDIVALDKQYEATFQLLDSLDEQIAAVEWLLDDVNTNMIPAAQTKANETGDMLDTQEVNDLANARDGLERKKADLLLTRMVTIQALPSIRIVQSNDKGLAEKLQSQMLNTLPLWKRTMALSIAAWRAEEAGKATKATTDFTNQLIVDSAKQLNTSNKVARTEIERGIFDVGAAVQANDLLISTITESIDLAEQGKAKRADAEKALMDAEQKLKEALRSAADRQAKLRAA
jgi:uncharacterized protein YaaN involved in tellurite resistance